MSDTSSRPRRRISLRLKLFLVILTVTLTCVLFFAFINNYLVRRQFEHAYRGGEFSYEPPPEEPPPLPDPSRFTEARGRRILYINLSYVFTGLLGVILAFILSWYLSNRISKPLSELTSATRSMAGGEYGKQVEVAGGKEVEELSEAFNSLCESLELNEMLRKSMVADVSHELRNPLAAQRGYLEGLEDGVIPLDREAVEVLMKNNVLLTRLVEDLRQLSLVDSGQVGLELMAVDAGEAVRAAASGFEREIAAKGISLAIEIPTGIAAVKADQGRISQVLVNLLRNAIQYTPEGGSVTLGVEEGEGEVTVCVRDSGPGIEEEELPFIFERFYRTDRSRTRDTGGTGLGLSIARGLVEAHGGRIWAESEAGVGTTVFFTLPVF
ncbi:MAG: ATP-binding protein [Actinomycetota bacterium]|nr:ATP-binding protein [Actinomycetota bacterium]